MRVKGGTTRKKRHKKVLKSTKGYRMTKSKLYKVANEARLHAGQYAHAHRQKRTGQMKKLWIKRINAAVSNHDMKYSEFINKLKKNNVNLNKRILAEIALEEPKTFENILKEIS